MSDLVPEGQPSWYLYGPIVRSLDFFSKHLVLRLLRGDDEHKDVHH